MATGKIKESLKQNIVPYIIMLLSFLLRYYYVSIISIYQNQHDAGNIYEGGDLAYFAYLINNGHLPDFDVSKVDQFWHPPLYYMLTAGTLKLAWFVFPSQKGNYEIAQLLPFLFVTVTIFIVWKILKLVFPDNKDVQNLSLLFVAFQPSLLMRSATLNTDAMSTCITVAMLYFLFRHIKKPQSDDIMCLLILFILGMWTKKSIAMCVVTVGVVYLYELIAEKKKDFLKALILMIICCPISMGWYIRLKLLWNIPFNFLWGVEDPTLVPGYIEGVSVWRRMTDFAVAHFSYVYTYVRNNTEAIDINPFTVLIKTSANDLWLWSYANDGITKLSYLLVLIRLLFAVLVVAGMLVFLFRKNPDRNGVIIKNKVTVGTFFILTIVSFYTFAFESPFICSMDYRYIEPVLVCETIAIGALAEKGKVPYWFIALVTLMMAAALSMKILRL